MAYSAKAGNVYIIDASGAINKGKGLFVKSIGIFEANTATAALNLTINGSTIFEHLGGIYPHRNSISYDLGGVWLESLSAKTVTACTGFLYLG